MAKDIQLTQGQVAIMDDDDYERLSQHKWFAQYMKNTKSFYAARQVYDPAKKHGQSMLLMHKAITGFKVTDHINCNTLDNRRSNLREATASQNGANRRPWRKLPKGVYLEKSGKWRAQIKALHKVHYLGLFNTMDEAKAAYDKAASELHGEFARLA